MKDYQLNTLEFPARILSRKKKKKKKRDILQLSLCVLFREVSLETILNFLKDIGIFEKI